MAYEKQTWAKGDVVTSAKLNHMEDGIATGGGVLVVNEVVENETARLDHTWQEIHDAAVAFKRGAAASGEGYSTTFCAEVVHVEGFGYGVVFDNEERWLAETVNDYPVYNEN